LHSQPNSARDAGTRPSPASAYPIPLWVKVFAVVALIAVAIVVALHLVGLGLGHLAHGGMDAHAPLAGHGQHQP
jgi:hypothetical protein